MLIISAYKDYYDSVAYSTGVDKSIVYKRDFTKVREDISVITPSLFNYSSNRDIPDMEVFLLGVCGKFYFGLKKTKQFTIESDYIYGLDNIREEFSKLSGFYQYRFNESIGELIELTNKKSLLDLFYKYKTPIFLFKQKNYNRYFKERNTDENIFLNPCLKDLEFMPLMDAYSLFQEIQMFVSQQLCRIDEPEQVSDKVKIISKGFDIKSSFRNVK